MADPILGAVVVGSLFGALMYVLRPKDDHTESKRRFVGQHQSWTRAFPDNKLIFKTEDPKDYHYERFIRGEIGIHELTLRKRLRDRAYEEMHRGGESPNVNFGPFSNDFLGNEDWGDALRKARKMDRFSR